MAVGMSRCQFYSDKSQYQAEDIAQIMAGIGDKPHRACIYAHPPFDYNIKEIEDDTPNQDFADSGEMLVMMMSVIMLYVMSVVMSHTNRIVIFLLFESV